jgi:hypothetical protein
MSTKALLIGVFSIRTKTKRASEEALFDGWAGVSN